MLGALVGLTLGLACLGYGVFQLVAPRREARFAVRYNRWWYARIPWLYSLPRMKQRLDEDWQTRASRPYGLLFVAVGIIISVRAGIAVVSVA